MEEHLVVVLRWWYYCALPGKLYDAIAEQIKETETCCHARV